MRKLVYLLLLPLLCFSGFQLSGQGTQVQYGKNRVQYHRDFDEWSQYESDNFIVYWYGEGRNVGQAVVQLAEFDFDNIQSILEHRINDKIQIIVYTDLTDIKQSNIGSEEAFTNTGGQTKIVGNQVFVYFDGNHNNLRRQIREGIASVYLNAMLFGSNLQEIVQNAVMLNLPNWFKDGLVAYVGEFWNTDLDNQLRDILLNEDFEGFDRFAEENPTLAGQSVWYFIGENYGRSTVSNLLYLTRINRSIESGFLYVLGNSFNAVMEKWEIYFKQRYLQEVSNKNNPEGQQLTVRNKRRLPLTRLKVSPDGSKIIYVLNEIGRYKVYLQEIGSGERKVIFKGGFRNAFQATDYNYPLIAWNPNGIEIGILYEKRDLPRFMSYDILTEKTIVEDLATNYQRVYSIDYINPNALVFSAAVNGFSDIFLYFTNTRQTQRLTNDFYDDLDAAFVRVENKRGIIFASNREDSLLLPQPRMDSILPIQTFDLYYLDLDNRSQELIRITHTPLANERQPAAIDSIWFSFLSDQTGIYNRKTGFLEEYVHHLENVITLKDGTEIVLHADSMLTSLDTALIDTVVTRPVIKKRAVNHYTSNYTRNITSQHTAPRTGRLVETVFLDGEFQVYAQKLHPDTVFFPAPSQYQQNRISSWMTSLREVPLPAEPSPMIARPQEELPPVEIPTKIEIPPIPTPAADTIKIDESFLFQTEFDDEEKQPTQPVTIIPEEAEQPPQSATIIQAPAPIPGQRLLESTSQKEVYRFRPGKIIPYRLKFRTDYVTTQVDNSLLFEGLESFASNPNDFGYPPPGILFKANFKDLFEDYEFEGGIRVPTSFDGTEYFLIFNNKKQRLDKRFAVYRKNTRMSEESPTFIPIKRDINILLGQFGVRYPLDIFRSIRATATLRRDRITQLASERPTLERATTSEERFGIKLEYVFDNTLDVDVNIKNGTRYKIFGEIVKKFDIDLDDGVRLDFNEGFMGILGVDARHYQRFLKHSILAFRFAGATSFGSEKILYYLGGVDNWMFPSFNNEIPSPSSGDFAYQTLATNLRGFDLNIRNGNSFALANTEVRIPMFKYFFRNLRSSLLRNLQVIGFFDVGTAWEGSDPFSDDNPLNISVFQRPPDNPLVSVKVNFFRDPIVAGYGIGARTMLFGYFVRVDYAWGIETRNVLDPKLYISLGTDF